MKKLILIVAILSIVALAFAADAVALLSASKGRVNLERASKDIKFKTGELLENKDLIRTGAESFAAYKYVDGSSTIKVFSNSVVSVNATQGTGTLAKRVNVNKGSVLAQVKSGTGAFTVQTPTTVASVKGTEFFTKVDDLGNSLFVVTDGEVEVKVLSTDETASVPAGKTASISADGEIEVRESTEDDTSAVEKEETQSSQNTQPKQMRVPVLDTTGRTRYIEITY
jgi:hypothetical protein